MSTRAFREKNRRFTFSLNEILTARRPNGRQSRVVRSTAVRGLRIPLSLLDR